VGTHSRLNLPILNLQALDTLKFSRIVSDYG
jgi:hypothetical protein